MMPYKKESSIVIRPIDSSFGEDVDNEISEEPDQCGEQSSEYTQF